LQTPTLVVAGANDADLGPDAQRRLMVPHFAYVRLVMLPDTGPFAADGAAGSGGAPDRGSCGLDQAAACHPRCLPGTDRF